MRADVNRLHFTFPQLSTAEIATPVTNNLD